MAKIINIEMTDNVISVDMTGDLDDSCCGFEERRLQEELAKLGIELEFKNIYCRLPIVEMMKAKISGECIKSSNLKEEGEGVGRMMEV